MTSTSSRAPQVKKFTHTERPDNFTNIPLFRVSSPEGVGSAVEAVWESGMVTEGVEADRFERAFGEFIGNPYVCLTNSGTSALDLAYAMLHIEPGDEIISSPMTCAATNEPLLHRGAKIVWCDIDPGTGNISLDSLKATVTPNTKAVVAVMWGGIPFDYEVLEFLRSRRIYLVIDAAHALGATWKNNKIIGEYAKENEGTITTFSFQAIKHLTTGDGGAIAFTPFNLEDAPAWAERCRKIRWFGLDRKYPGSKWEQDIMEAGFKYHMNNMNAAIGLLQMPGLSRLIEVHKENAAYYDAYIQNPNFIAKPLVDYSKVSPSWWLYTLSLNNKFDRDVFINCMHEVGIQTDVVHVRNDQYTCFSASQTEGLENVRRFNDTHVCIPVGWWLTKEQRRYIVRRVNEFKLEK